MKLNIIRNFLFLTLSIAVLSCSPKVQVDFRESAPTPKPEPVLNIGEYKHFSMDNGLEVYVVENFKRPDVSFSFIFDYPPVYERNKAGVGQVTGTLMRAGTKSLSKEELDEEVDFIAATLSVSSSNLFASGLTRHKERLIELATDVLLNPAFEQSELEKIKKQRLSALDASKEDPSSIASNVARALVYGKDHPYGEIVTDETIESISVDDCKAFYERYYVPKNSYLAIVGNISMEEAKALVEEHLNNWNGEKIYPENYPLVSPPVEREISFVNRSQSVQSVVSVNYPIERKYGGANYIADRVMNQILGGGFSSRLMQNLREDKGYTYGARSSMGSDRYVARFVASASVRNEVTSDAVGEFLHELESIRNMTVTENELELAKNAIKGQFFRSLEQPLTIASFALNTARYNLSEDYYRDFLKNLDAVTIDDVKRSAERYIHPDNVNIVIVGKASDVAESLEEYGNINYYDNYGNPVVYDNSTMETDVEAKTILENYINSIGGYGEVSNINALKMNYKGNFQGQGELVYTLYWKPNKYRVTISMQNFPLITQVYNNGSAAIISQGGIQRNLPNDVRGKLTLRSKSPFEEISFLDNPDMFNMEVKGIEVIDGRAMYVLSINSIEHSLNQLNYYGVDDGLLYQSVSIVKNPQNGQEQSITTSFEDYSEISDVMYPNKMTLALGVQNVTLELDVVEKNLDINDSIFSTDQ